MRDSGDEPSNSSVHIVAIAPSLLHRMVARCVVTVDAGKSNDRLPGFRIFVALSHATNTTLTSFTDLFNLAV